MGDDASSPAAGGVPEAQPLVHRHVSLLSDYGHGDESVGVVHSVIKALAPGVDVIDITHGIAPYDVRGAALALARSVQYMCPGVVVAMVDPGAGSGRRAVAVEVGGGSSFLLGPDNGILAPAVSMVGGATAAVELDNSEHHLEAPGPAFSGRDVFAPVAASLCRGVPLAELGSSIDPVSLLPGTLPLSRTEPDGIHTEVLWVDRFGNVQLNLDPEELEGPGTRFELDFAGQRLLAERVGSFGALSTGAVGLMVDSHGLVSLVADRASASEQTGLVEGDEVVISAAGESPPAPDGDGPPAIAVELGPRPGAADDEGQVGR